jgi:hypothetical protein
LVITGRIGTGETLSFSDICVLCSLRREIFLDPAKPFNYSGLEEIGVQRVKASWNARQEGVSASFIMDPLVAFANTAAGVCHAAVGPRQLVVLAV